jgi:Flp pilus assembly protein TadB
MPLLKRRKSTLREGKGSVTAILSLLVVGAFGLLVLYAMFGPVIIYFVFVAFGIGGIGVLHFLLWGRQMEQTRNEEELPDA